MSDNIPFEIQAEIIKRLPVKSLVQFRSVSKTWKSLIDSSQFIAHYSTQHTNPQHNLLVSYEYYYGFVGEPHYVSIVDDDTFPQHKVSVPVPFDWLKYCSIVGCSHGLLCLYGNSQDDPDSYCGPTAMAALWNISIRKAVAVVVPLRNWALRTVLGFGVCRETTEIKIIKIRCIEKLWDTQIVTSIPWQVEIFTLSSGVWRRPCSSNLPRTSIKFGWSKVDVDGVLYWLAADRIVVDDGGCKFYNLIVSFDMTSEEFMEINLPDCLAFADQSRLFMSKLRESLVVIVYGEDVWMMGDGVPKSFTKLFSVDVVSTLSCASVIGFRKSGEPVIQMDYDGVFRLVYDRHLKHISTVELDDLRSLSVNLYMETLLLLDQKNRTVYFDI